MATESVFRGIINFFNDIGVYDVILPFLLVFTIMFAILEKTRVLGEDEVDMGKEKGKVKYSKKNLDSVVAFVVAFLVIASAQLVSLINEAMANVVILVLVGICALMLVGVLTGTGEFKFKEDSWTLWFFTAFMILGVLLVFFHAIPTSSGESLLDWFFDYMYDNWDSNAVGALILIGLVSLFMWGIVREPTKSKEKKEGETK